jgi:hypothetical protein
MERRGKQIPGSKYYRDYCVNCDAPMRVTWATYIKMRSLCEDCDPKPENELPHVAPRCAGESSPWEEKVIREYEDHEDPAP